MRIAFVLPGLHRVSRGAEVVFESIAQELALGGDEVLLLGSGQPRTDRAYRFRHVPAAPREWFERLPKVPLLRSHYMYEELTFAAAAALVYRPQRFDVTITCSYPYVNWLLRVRPPGRPRPAHVFVTQNGDWPAYHDGGEFRFFSCDGLVCTNPRFFERNRERWFSTLIPNGVDPARFRPGPGPRAAFGLPADRPVVLMVSALSPAKRVLEGMRAVAALPEPFLAVAGDGPQRAEVDALAAQILPGRFLRGTFPHDRMPDLYRCADVFLHPCLEESFGNVYIEALATGLPVVAHDVDVTRWILREHGILVDARSEDALAAGLEAAFALGRRGLAERVGFASTEYSWKSVGARYRSFLHETVQRRASARAGARPRAPAGRDR